MCVLYYSSLAWTQTLLTVLACKLSTTKSLQNYLSNSDYLSRKAMVRVGIADTAFRRERELIDTLRLLIQSQDDISPRDTINFCSPFARSLKVVEFMYSNSSVPSEFNVSDGEEIFPFLAITLREFYYNPPQWENFLRLLLRDKANLHSRVPRNRDFTKRTIFSHEVSEYGTPLDELFSRTKTPFEGEAIANRWLQILLSEGFDIVAYLEEEFALHAQQMQLTVPYDDGR